MHTPFYKPISGAESERGLCGLWPSSEACPSSDFFYLSSFFFLFSFFFFFNRTSLVYACVVFKYYIFILFFLIRRNLTPWKAYFVGLGEGVKPRLFQTLTRDARPDSNSRPAVQISNFLSSRYTPWRLKY